MHFSKLFQYCPKCGSQLFVQNNEKSKHCQSCDFVMYVNASAAVAAFIVNDQSELLVCRRAKEPAKGTLDLPGGFVDDNETAEQAVVREVNEELNISVVASEYLFSLPNKYEYSGWTIPTLDLFFLCKIKDFDSIKAADDVESFHFVPVNQLKTSEFGLDSIRKGISIFLKEREI